MSSGFWLLIIKPRFRGRWVLRSLPALEKTELESTSPLGLSLPDSDRSDQPHTGVSAPSLQSQRQGSRCVWLTGRVLEEKERQGEDRGWARLCLQPESTFGCMEHKVHPPCGWSLTEAKRANLLGPVSHCLGTARVMGSQEVAIFQVRQLLPGWSNLLEQGASMSW